MLRLEAQLKEGKFDYDSGLLENVIKALTSNENLCEASVALYHQSGCGGPDVGVKWRS